MKFKLALFSSVVISIYIILYNSTDLNFNNRIELNQKTRSKQDRIILKFVCHLKPLLNNKSNALKVLIISSKSNTVIRKELTILFELNRINYKIITPRPNRLNVIRLNTNQTLLYNLIVFETSSLFYDSVDFNNKLNLADFCNLFNVGLIIFSDHDPSQIDDIKYSKQLNFINDGESIKLNYLNDLKPQKCFLKCSNDIFKLTKCNNGPNDFLSVQNKSKYLSSSFNFDPNFYESLFQCDSNLNLILKSKSKLKLILISNDLIELVQIFSSILFDLISYASNNRFKIDLDRFVQIDIDDIFVGSSGKRMIPNDVNKLIDFQENYLNKLIFNMSSHKFRFNLGFSGYYYQSGNHLENEGDHMLIRNKNYFNWFDHGWSHYQNHILNSTSLLEQMYYNYNFALSHDLPVDSFYAVSPHHSGIYPVYDQFFKHWSEVWLIKATSTEEYPHLRPYWLRRGFIHNDIMVLPRQTCGIYTHTIFINSYPNGFDSLISMIHGGEIFKTIIYNKILVYMTHMTNYGSDRIALHLFRNVFDYVTKWTHLRFESLPAYELAKKYFEIYPQDKEPIWTNICLDKRHVNVWSLNDTSYCDRFPKLIILGPQKTGSTALHTYLNEHPWIKSNIFTKENFEETQFFSNKNYFKGLDWYLKLFPKPFNSSMILFEKSANYFTEPKAPLRIRNLIKSPKFVIITINPVDRAYSWYQHMKYHNDTIALNYSFNDVIRLNSSNLTVLIGMKKLRERCIDPGFYHKHFSKWLKYFSPSQFFLVDGDKLRYDPYETLLKLQEFTGIDGYLNYKRILKYNVKKKFFCVNEIRFNRIKCLGSSKGRIYSKMDDKSRLYLTEFYKSSNKLFFKLLRKFKYDAPLWLKKELNIQN